ncbi:DUF305 domain-containing protein [uncultured Jatrophihabitans sp.]|uniref:DUF305 domain-containing protein n=1 Tax=uncultured Jatrophihabitans sp. TaxID=1610747 RepID=UPI0035CBF379
MTADAATRVDPDFSTVDDDVADDGVDQNRGGRGLRRALVAVIAVAALVLAGALGFVLNGDGSSSGSTAKPSAVDVGFAQDMSTHHVQAVTMAGYERDNTTSPAMRNLAFDIESGQQFQVGEMQGWLDQWGESRNNPDQMAWMGSGMGIGSTALMPGMATPAQMSRLETLHGKALDILFLQLMIHHHQGGLPMAAYARDHATNASVVRLAGAMYTLQSNELVQMEQMLRGLGGTMLPPPSH